VPSQPAPKGPRSRGPVDAFAQRLEASLVQRIELGRYDVWFRPHTKFILRDGQLTVGVPNLFSQEWLEKTFGEAVREAAAEVLGKPVPVRFAIDPELFQEARAEQEKARNAERRTPNERRTKERDADAANLSGDRSSAAEHHRKRAVESQGDEPTEEFRVPRSALRAHRKWRSLGDFVVGRCNRVAHASALSVIEEPGQGANPLVLYGPVGTGKTHLLEGIYAGLRRNFSEARIVFTTAEDFLSRFVQAMHLNKQSSFRRHFRECSILLVDDLNFLARGKGSQVEFLHTFDALLAEGRQVVVTCDCHPRLTEDLMPELIDRLIGGAVWSLLPPDADTRLAILQAKSAGGTPLIPEAVLQFLAKQLRGNVRELEGAIHSIRHFSRATGRPIDLNLAREALGDLLRHAVRVVGMADIDAAVCSVLRLPANTLRSKSRTWAVSHPRMIGIYLCRKHTAASYSEISIYFGNKTHSTAVAAEKTVRSWLQADRSVKAGERDCRVRELIERIERELQR